MAEKSESNQGIRTNETLTGLSKTVDDNEELRRMVLEQKFIEVTNRKEQIELLRKDYTSAFENGEPYEMTEEIQKLGLTQDFLIQRSNNEKLLKWNNFMVRAFGEDD
jgi:hypothetical protein